MAEMEIGAGEKLKAEVEVCPECAGWERFDLGPVVDGKRTKIDIKCGTCRGNGHIGGIYDTLPRRYDSVDYKIIHGDPDAPKPQGVIDKPYAT